MTAESLLSSAIAPLRTSDTGEIALEMMGELMIRHLPVVNDKQLLGVISEAEILNYDINDTIGSYNLSLPRPFARRGDHFYEIMRLISELDLTAIPVVDDDGNYMGVITLETVFKYFSRTVSFAEPGSIVVLELNRRDYSLAEIARIAESENVAILSSFITSFPDSPRIDITLKLNRQDTHALLASFERFKYEIKASYQESEYMDNLRDRYEALLSYLNI